MPRRRANDPLHVSDTPVWATAPAKIAARKHEFVQKLTYVRLFYLALAQIYHPLSRLQDDIRKLRLMAKSSSTIAWEDVESLHPEIMAVVYAKARTAARNRSGQEDPALTDQDIRAGVETVAEGRVRGRPKDHPLDRCVPALIALIQDVLGMPVTALKEPARLTGMGGQALKDHWHQIDPGTSETALVNIVLKSRRAYAGKPMRFRDFCPNYTSSPATKPENQKIP